MTSCNRALGSSIGLKVQMALSGAVLVGFMITHLVGNGLIFAGQATLNNYAKALHDNVALLWLVRIVMLLAVPVHVVTAIRLTKLNRAARPIEYVQKNYRKATFASRSMAASGMFLLVFLIFHLAHYTWRIVDPAVNQIDASDVYRTMVTGFSSPITSLFYIIAVVLLGTHLSHGVSSIFQTLGINHPRWNPVIRKLGPLAGVIFVVGFVLIPLSVLLGFIS
jgi:succinate dehydrogenase / fumarate reductase, cytochrome b subunit